MQARTAEAGGTAVYSATDTRDAAGRIVQTTCSVEGESHTWAFTCDDAGRLTQVTRDGTPVHIHQYGPTGPSGTITATYDDRDRLVQSGDTDYGAGFAFDRWIASMASSTGSSSFTSRLPRFSSSCSMLVAPTMLLVRNGRLFT